MNIFVISADRLPASVEASVSIIVIVEASRSLNDDDNSDHGSDASHALEPHYLQRLSHVIYMHMYVCTIMSLHALLDQ